MQSTIPVMRLRLSDASIICMLLAVSSQFSLLFLIVGRQAAVAAYVIY